MPKLLYVVRDGFVYYNQKCLLCKPDIIIDDPLINDIFIKAHAVGKDFSNNDYEETILGLNTNANIRSLQGEYDRIQMEILIEEQIKPRKDEKINKFEARKLAIINQMKKERTKSTNSANNDGIDIIITFDNITFVENKDMDEKSMYSVYPKSSGLITNFIEPFINSLQNIKSNYTKLEATSSTASTYLSNNSLSDNNLRDFFTNPENNGVFDFKGDEITIKTYFDNYLERTYLPDIKDFYKTGHKLDYLRYLYLDNVLAPEFIQKYKEACSGSIEKVAKQDFKQDSMKECKKKNLNESITVNISNGHVFMKKEDYISFIDEKLGFFIAAIILPLVKIPFQLFDFLFKDELFMPVSEDGKPIIIIDENKTYFDSPELKLIQYLMDDFINFKLILKEPELEKLNKLFDKFTTTDTYNKKSLYNTIVQRVYDNYILIQDLNKTTTTGGISNDTFKINTIGGKNNTRHFHVKHNNTIKKKVNKQLPIKKIKGGYGKNEEDFKKWSLSKVSGSDSGGKKTAVKTAFVATKLLLNWVDTPVNKNFISNLMNMWKSQNEGEIYEHLQQKNLLLATLFKRVTGVGFFVDATDIKKTISDDKIKSKILVWTDFQDSYGSNLMYNLISIILTGNDRGNWLNWFNNTSVPVASIKSFLSGLTTGKILIIGVAAAAGAAITVVSAGVAAPVIAGGLTSIGLGGIVTTTTALAATVGVGALGATAGATLGAVGYDRYYWTGTSLNSEFWLSFGAFLVYFFPGIIVAVACFVAALGGGPLMAVGGGVVIIVGLIYSIFTMFFNNQATAASIVDNIHINYTYTMFSSLKLIECSSLDESPLYIFKQNVDNNYTQLGGILKTFWINMKSSTIVEKDDEKTKETKEKAKAAATAQDQVINAKKELEKQKELKEVQDKVTKELEDNLKKKEEEQDKARAAATEEEEDDLEFFLADDPAAAAKAEAAEAAEAAAAAKAALDADKAATKADVNTAKDDVDKAVAAAKTAAEAAKNTATQFEIPVKKDTRGNIKNLIKNIEIPMIAFQYALAKTKSTYPEELAKDLVDYNTDKDSFMEKRKKKLEKK